MYNIISRLTTRKIKKQCLTIKANRREKQNKKATQKQEKETENIGQITTK